MREETPKTEWMSAVGDKCKRHCEPHFSARGTEHYHVVAEHYGIPAHDERVIVNNTERNDDNDDQDNEQNRC